MKKLIAATLALTLALSATACSKSNKTSGGSDAEKATSAVTSAADTTAADTTAAANQLTTEAVKADLDSLMTEYELEGVAYLTQNGNVIYQYTNGKDLNGADFTTDTPMPVGSVSKQFCAAAILSLRDSGKLSLDDTLDKYFPEYTEGKKINLKHLLSMRSGIADLNETDDMSAITLATPEEAVRAAVRGIIFGKPLDVNPGVGYNYCNANYMLLSMIVEQVSGQSYISYLRSTMLEPLGMQNTGSIDELQSGSPAWAKGIKYAYPAGLATGAGDIISTATDMEKWMTGLKSGSVLSLDSYREMTTDYSPDDTPDSFGYGYGLVPNYKRGVGHEGNILIEEIAYSAFDYIDEQDGVNLFLAGSDCMPADMGGLRSDTLDVIVGLLDGSSQ